MPRKRIPSMLVVSMMLAFAPLGRVSAASAQTHVQPSTPEAATAQKQEAAKDEDDAYRHSPMVTKMGAFIGMNSEQAATTFTISNLVILFAGIGYFLFKNLPKTFRGRSATIQKQIVDARAATQDAKSRLSAVEERLSKLDSQIADMRKQADMDGAREEERLKGAIEEEKQRILAAAGLEIQSATQNARRELQKYAAELAIDQAARKLVITPEADRFLVEGFADRLQAFGKAKN